MKIELVFKNSGDSLPIQIVYNNELVAFLLDKFQGVEFNYEHLSNVNAVLSSKQWCRQVDNKVKHIQNCISKLNPVLEKLIAKQFELRESIIECLDQNYLNKLHNDWAISQKNNIVIKEVYNQYPDSIGQILFNRYPDNIPTALIADVLDKLNLLNEYEDLNITIHDLEICFNQLCFVAEDKWEIFDNTFKDIEFNDSITNFYLGYTYVGRQNQDKFNNFENGNNTDYWNFETLEYSFHCNLRRPQTIPFSTEFVNWCNTNGIKVSGNKLPMGNFINLEKNLLDYRKIVYNNIRQQNSASLHLV